MVAAPCRIKKNPIDRRVVTAHSLAHCSWDLGSVAKSSILLLPFLHVVSLCAGGWGDRGRSMEHARGRKGGDQRVSRVVSTRGLMAYVFWVEAREPSKMFPKGTDCLNSNLCPATFWLCNLDPQFPRLYDEVMIMIVNLPGLFWGWNEVWLESA